LNIFKTISLILAVTLTTLSGHTVSAQDFGKGWLAYQSGDYAAAVKEFRPLAEQGNEDAQYNLGWMYDKGEGVTQDYAEAVKWYRKAAEQGNKYGQNNLGVMYAKGTGVIQDNVYAHIWYNIAASLGNETASENRDLMADFMTSADISKAQELARECVRKNYKGC
jgi:TPR repeat protein